MNDNMNFAEGFTFACVSLDITSISELANALGVRMALVSDTKRRNVFPSEWSQSINNFTKKEFGMNAEQKNYLKAAALTVEQQSLDTPELGIPVDPEVASHMGAFEETALAGDGLDEGGNHDYKD